METIGTIESKILGLAAKGIRPSDIAKIYDLERKEVIQVVQRHRRKAEEERRTQAALEKIMKISSVGEEIARKILAAVRETLTTKP